MENNTNIVEFAEQILELEDDRKYWKRQAEHYKGLYEMWYKSAEESNQNTMNILGDVFIAALDENSGLCRMHRSLARDPLKGATE